MDRKRASGGEPDDGFADADAGEPRQDRDEGPGHRPEAERFGPLHVTRLRKDDGRALLVFARAPERP